MRHYSIDINHNIEYRDNMIIEVYPIDGKKCRQIIDDMIKTPTERKTQVIKDKLRRFMQGLSLTNKKESNTELHSELMSNIFISLPIK